jgi:hypothetical protein
LLTQSREWRSYLAVGDGPRSLDAPDLLDFTVAAQEAFFL